MRKSVRLFYLFILSIVSLGVLSAQCTYDSKTIYTPVRVPVGQLEIKYSLPLRGVDRDSMLYRISLNDNTFEFLGLYPGIVKYVCMAQSARRNITYGDIYAVLNDTSLKQWKAKVLQNGLQLSGKEAQAVSEYLTCIMLENSPVLPDFGVRKLAMKDNPLYHYKEEKTSWDSIEVSIEYDFEKQGAFHGGQAVKVTHDSVYYYWRGHTTAVAINDGVCSQISSKLANINRQSYLEMWWFTSSLYECQLRVDGKLLYYSQPYLDWRCDAYVPYKEIIEYILSLSPDRVIYNAEMARRPERSYKTKDKEP